MFKVAMKSMVKDVITGFSGIVTARAEYSTGCRQYLVQPKQKRGENGYPKSAWLDEDRICNSVTKNAGGPQQYAAPTK